MKNIKITIEYDGTAYAGWQNQPGCRTVQGEIEKAIKTITKEDITIYGSGRTDRGVHARGQVANFYTQSSIPAERFKFALNSALPMDIVITSSKDIDGDFHARYHAIGKEYCYLIYNAYIRSPLWDRFSFHVPYELDRAKMLKATEHFIGTHDFSGFMSKGSSIKTTVRTIHALTLEERGSLIEVRIKGNGFLYNMVRIIVGTLVQVGSGRINPSHLPEIIASKNRKMAGPTVPSNGLYLEQVYYHPEEIE